MSITSSRGLYFDEFEVGQEFESPGRTITETDVVMFAGLSGDYNQLHTDVEFTGKTAFGQRIAHGLLGLSIGSGLAARIGFIEGTTDALMGIGWKFKAPILIGDTVHLVAVITKTRSMPGHNGGVVSLNARVINQKGKVVQQGEWTLLMKGRPTE